MNLIKIYIKGTTGFKPALKAQLGDVWAYSHEDIGADIVTLLMAGDSGLETLKASVGEYLILTYDLRFLTTLDEHRPVELSKMQFVEEPLKMTVWTGRDSNIRAREIKLPLRDPAAPRI